MKKDYVAREDKDGFLCKGCNVIFVSLTNLRSDHLGLYGYHRNTSPHIDAFFKNAIIFENAFTVASWTLTAAMSVYTSMYPFTHNVMVRYSAERFEDGPVDVLSEAIPTLVDVLNSRGYETASINGGADYLPSHNLTNRFKYFDCGDSVPPQLKNYGSLNAIGPKAIEWLERNHAKKFFLHIQAFDTHCPFAYPQENDMFDPDYQSDVDYTNCYWTFDRTEPIYLKKGGETEKYYNLQTDSLNTVGADASDNGQRPEYWKIKQMFNEREIQHMVALYDGEIFNADRQLGVILDKLKELRLMDNTIIVFFSEHGDMFGKYGRFMRGGPLRGTFYDDVLRVPLIIYHPKQKSIKINSLVSLIDLSPTILEFLDIKRPAEFEGQSLVATLKNDNVDRNIFAGAAHKSNKGNQFFGYSTVIAAVRNKEWKLIKELIRYDNNEDVNVSYELFNVKNDPEELHNLAEEKFGNLEEMNNILNEWMKVKLGKGNPFDKIYKQ